MSSTADSKIEKTTDYDQFTFIDTNREIVEKHVRELVKAIQDNGNLSAVQPVIVNEHGQIIDGQHTLTALKELGLPVYFRVVEGLNAQDARQMNIHRKNWTSDDYARSYAASGDTNYQRYLDLVEEYGFSGTIILTYAKHGNERGMHKNFRMGEFELAEEDVADVKRILDMYSEVCNVLGGKTTKAMSEALLYCFLRDGYDQRRMLRKLNLYRHLLRNFSSVKDNQRQLEDIYNTGQSEETRLRLY